MKVVTYKCPVSKNVIIIRYTVDNAHIENIEFDDINLKSFFNLLMDVINVSKEYGVNTFTQVVSDEDWNNILHEISGWSIMYEIKDMKAKIIRCDAKNVVECIGSGFGVKPAEYDYNTKCLKEDLVYEVVTPSKN